MKTDLKCHPQNVFDEMSIIIDLMGRSEIPEMNLASRSLKIEVDNLVGFMLKNRIDEVV
jgi:hypothetical protein